MPTVELRFTALPGHVRTARMIATAVSRRAGVPAAAIDEIRLAVGEACARAVQVNRKHDPHALVHVALTDSTDAFTVTVSDCGSPEDDIAAGLDGGLVSAPALLHLADPAGGDQDQPAPAAAALPWDDPGDEEPPFPPGLGLAVIEGLVDEVDIRRGPDGVGTVVEMRWRTGAAPEPEAGRDADRDLAIDGQVALASDRAEAMAPTEPRP